MDTSQLVGIVLVAGLVVFFVGAAGWKLEYDGPMRDALTLIHADRRRRAWIHLWMIPATFLTTAGLAGLPSLLGRGVAPALATMGAIVYALGAVCWIVSLAFRLTVSPWAAERTVADGDPPASFAALDAWAGSLYVVHMASAYVAFSIIGAAVVAGGVLAPWLGWLGVGWGLVFVGGLIATRPEGAFNPPFWAHAYTATIGVVLLVG